MLKLVLDTIEGLPDAIAAEYAEKDGKFYLQTEAAGGLSVENVAPLKKTLETVRGELRQAHDKIKAFEGIDDPKLAKEALAKYEQMKDWTPDQKVKEQIDALKKDLISKHDKEVGEWKTKHDATYRQLEQNMVHAAALDALTKAGAGKRAKLALPHLLNQVRMRESGDRFIVEVVDAQGNPRVGDAQGNPMTISQLVEEMRGTDDFAPVFDGSGSTGSGGSSSGRSGGSNGTKTIKVDGGVISGVDIEKIASGELEVKTR